MNRLAVIIVTLFCSSLALAQLLPGEAEQLQQAEAHFQAGAFRQAADVLEPLAQRRPADADIHRLLGHVWYRLDQPEKARESLVVSLKAQGLQPDTLALLAAIDRQANRPGHVLAAMGWLTLLEPGDLAYQLVYLDTLQQLGQYQAAVAAGQNLLEQHPGSPELLQLLAGAHLPQQRHRDALDLLVTARALGLEDAAVDRMIAQLYVQLGQTQAAIRDLEQAANARSADDPSVQLRLARLLAATGQYQQAQAQLLAMPHNDHSPASGEQLILLGQVQAALGDQAAALTAWRQAIQAGVRDQRVLMATAAAAINQQADSLPRDLERLTGFYDRAATDLLVAGYLQLGQPGQAQQAVERYVAAHRLDAHAKAWLARIWQNQSPAHPETMANQGR